MQRAFASRTHRLRGNAIERCRVLDRRAADLLTVRVWQRDFRDGYADQLVEDVSACGWKSALEKAREFRDAYATRISDEFYVELAR